MKKTTMMFKIRALTITVAMLTVQVFPISTVYATEAIPDSNTELILEDNSDVTDEKGTEVLFDGDAKPSPQDDSGVLFDDNTQTQTNDEPEVLLDSDTKTQETDEAGILSDEQTEVSANEVSDEQSEELEQYAAHNSLYGASPNPSELLLGIFFSSEEDQSDTLYVSFDGLEFRKIGYAFEDSNKSSSSNNRIVNGPSYEVNCLHDPALQFYNGNYWSMSGWTLDHRAKDGKRVFVPMLASSPDLVNWTYPNSGSADNIVPTGKKPYGKNGNRDNDTFDCVAPDLLIEDNGTAWIVVSMGYYASWHGDSPLNDKMSPYLIKVTGLKPGSTNPVNTTEKGKQPTVTYSDAMPINLPTDKYKNRIDGSLYKENGAYYLAIKDNGVTNEIWRIDNLNNCQDSGKWTLVNKDIVTGYEGPSITKYMGRYYCFTDKLATYPPDKFNGKTGTHMSCSDAMNKEWSANIEIKTIDKNGNKIPNRHGSVITVKDSTQITKIMNLYYKAGWKYDPQKDKPGTGNEIWRYNSDGKAYWYENGVIQGTYSDPKGVIGDGTVRGREIYDRKSDGWYWLDSVYRGAKAVGKEVWMPYIYQDEAKWNEAKKRQIAYESDSGMGECVFRAMQKKDGKWVRYDENGKMLKGWVTISGPLAVLYPDQKGNKYYYDHRTGLMAKGRVVIDGQEHYFDEVSGVCIK